jgi:hypothetical protein
MASILFIAGSKKRQKESPAKHERDSGAESQSLFFAGFTSRLRIPARFPAGFFMRSARGSGDSRD